MAEEIEEIMDESENESIPDDILYLLHVTKDQRHTCMFLGTSKDDNHTSVNVWDIGLGRSLKDATNVSQKPKYTFKFTMKDILTFIKERKAYIDLDYAEYSNTPDKGISCNIYRPSRY